MKIEILGSGGATLTPRPFSQSQVSQIARAKGHPYTRMGPAYFIHDIELLIDTPEEIAIQIERSGIQRIKSAIYSHWHPDHTSGIRLWEANTRLWTYPPERLCTDIYLPAKVAADFQHWIGLEERLGYLEKTLKVVRRVVVGEGETFQCGDIIIQPILLSVGYVYAFLFYQADKIVLIAPDETFGWQPQDLPPLDLAIIPAGLFEFNPFTNERIIPDGHPILSEEATFENTLGMLERLKPKQTILAHIEEVNGLDYDDFIRLSDKLAAERPDLGPITFAYDRQIIEV